MIGFAPEPYDVIEMLLPEAPEPPGVSWPVQVVPALKRMLSPAVKVVPLTPATEFQGLALVPVPLEEAEQST
jgi:hypothetical protein